MPSPHFVQTVLHFDTMKLLILTLLLSTFYGTNAFHIPVVKRDIVDVVPPIDEDVIPLVITQGEPFKGPKGRCLQNMRMNPLMESIELPQWVGHQYEDIFFFVDCHGLNEATAIVSKDTSPLQMAKYFAVTYFSTVHVMDWRKAEMNEERMAVVDQFWETGKFYKEGDFNAETVEVLDGEFMSLYYESGSGAVIR